MLNVRKCFLDFGGRSIQLGTFKLMHSGLYCCLGPSEWNAMTGTEMEGEVVMFKTLILTRWFLKHHNDTSKDHPIKVLNIEKLCVTPYWCHKFG